MIWILVAGGFLFGVSVGFVLGALFAARRPKPAQVATRASGHGLYAEGLRRAMEAPNPWAEHRIRVRLIQGSLPDTTDYEAMAGDGWPSDGEEDLDPYDLAEPPGYG